MKRADKIINTVVFLTMCAVGWCLGLWADNVFHKPLKKQMEELTRYGPNWYFEDFYEPIATNSAGILWQRKTK